METSFDPAAQLQELQNAQDAAAVEAWMPETPIWHAPLLALFVLSMGLLFEGPAGMRIPAALVALATVAYGFWDSLRRRNARPKGMRKPARVIAFAMVITAASWLLITGVSAAIAETVDSWAGDPTLAAFTLLGIWLTATVLFTGSIWATNVWRDKWLKAAR